jgi:hypothetical protein
MLKISIVEGRQQRRLVLEGKLIAPWAAEIKTAYEASQVDLNGRELMVEVKHLTAISQEGENVLCELINQGVRFRCCGVFTKHVLKELTRRVRRSSSANSPEVNR